MKRIASSSFSEHLSLIWGVVSDYYIESCTFNSPNASKFTELDVSNVPNVFK